MNIFPKIDLNFSNDQKVNLFSYNTPSLTEETRLQTDFVEALFHLPWFVQFFQPRVTIRRWKISTNTGGVQMKKGGWGEKNQDALQAGRASVCRVSKQEKLSPRTNWGEEKKKEDRDRYEESVIEDPPPHDRATVTNNSSESTDRSERVPAVILSLLPLFLFHSVRF